MSARIMRVMPNVLSALRLALAAVFPALPVSWRLPAMIGGALSDWIDGVLARRYTASSARGALLDAVADKCFTVSVLATIVLSPGGGATWWQALLALSRDVVVGAIALYALAIGRSDALAHMRPRLPGKLATTAVFVWLASVLAGAPPGVRWVLFALAGACSIIAAVDYFGQFLRRYAEVEGVATRSLG